MLSARLELAAIAATSRLSRHRVLTHKIAFDPPGLGSTTCDRITSSTECHIEKHIKPFEKDRDASKLGECVLDDSEEDCSDGCCCFTEKNSEEECRRYQLDNYTLTALVESGNEEYQHFQNATGHWVRRLGRKVCPALVAQCACGAIPGGLAASRCRGSRDNTLEARPKSPNIAPTASDPTHGLSQPDGLFLLAQINSELYTRRNREKLVRRVSQTTAALH